MSEIPQEEFETEEQEEAKVTGMHEAVWGGSAEVSPEGEELEIDLVEEDYSGSVSKKAEAADFEISAETGLEENPFEVEGYDPPAAETQEEKTESIIADNLAGAYIPAGESTLIQETVLGTDDRRRISNTRLYPWRTMCYLEITAADGRRYIGSGNFIGPHTVMTAGHCVYMHRHGGWVRRIKVVPGANATVEPFGSATGTRFCSVTGWTRSRSPNYDYGAIILGSNTLGRRVGWIGFAALSWLNLIRLRVNNSGYPGDKPRKTQWWNCNRVVFVASRRLYYLNDTAGGQSGSPVWRYKSGRRHQVAIHAYGGTSSNSGVRITTPVFNNMKKWKS